MAAVGLEGEREDRLTKFALQLNAEMLLCFLFG